MLYIFDMGGVLLHGVFELKTILENAGHHLDLMNLYRDDLMDKLSAGLIEEDAYWKEFNARYGTDIASPQWGRQFNPEVDPEMIALIKELKKNNRVICGTNTIEAHWQFSQDRGDYKVFDKVYASHLMGVAKPDARFWETILEEEGAKPEEAVFIDDFHDNVDAAASLGIRSILYSNINALREELTLSV